MCGMALRRLSAVSGRWAGGKNDDSLRAPLCWLWAWFWMKPKGEAGQVWGMALRWMRDVDSANPGRTPSLRGRAAIRFLQRLRPIPVVPEGAAAPGFRSDVTEVGIRNPGGRGEAENRRALEPMPLRATQQGRDSGTCPLSPAFFRGEGADPWHFRPGKRGILAAVQGRQNRI